MTYGTEISLFQVVSWQSTVSEATPSLPFWPGWCAKTTTLTILFQRRATSLQTQSRQCSSSDQSRWWTFKTTRRKSLGCLRLLLGQALQQRVVDASWDALCYMRLRRWRCKSCRSLRPTPHTARWVSAFQLVRWVRFCNRNESHNANLWGWQYRTVSTSVVGIRKWSMWSDMVKWYFVQKIMWNVVVIWDFQPSFLASISAVRYSKMFIFGAMVTALWLLWGTKSKTNCDLLLSLYCLKYPKGQRITSPLCQYSFFLTLFSLAPRDVWRTQDLQFLST